MESTRSLVRGWRCGVAPTMPGSGASGLGVVHPSRSILMPSGDGRVGTLGGVLPEPRRSGTTGAPDAGVAPVSTGPTGGGSERVLDGCPRSAAPSDRARRGIPARHDRTWRHEGERLALCRSARDGDPHAPRAAPSHRFEQQRERRRGDRDGHQHRGPRIARGAPSLTRSMADGDHARMLPGLSERARRSGLALEWATGLPRRVVSHTTPDTRSWRNRAEPERTQGPAANAAGPCVQLLLPYRERATCS